ncbi:protein D3 isoform X2 [Bemisia tabaci]|uniref:protein D3 isoform X2 n=1 Tax=Bemisia tabaci TaxID=7038 RepID=UPI003B283B90
MQSQNIYQPFTLFWSIGFLKSSLIVATTEYTYKDHYEMKDICVEHKIIPDVITEAPEDEIELAYNEYDYVHYGTYLTVDQIKEKPTLLRWRFLPNLLYTLLLISPDHPTRENPDEKEWQYWIVSNIHGGDLKLSRTLTEYSPPTEILGKEPHRMIFMVFLQSAPRAVNFNEPYIKKETISKERAHFNTREFAKKHNFTKLVALNFFLMKPTKKT